MLIRQKIFKYENLNKYMSEKSNFEKQTEEITYKIYPFLIKDLKDIYQKDFDNRIIADIGCGPGFLIKELAKLKFSQIYGIDISENMLVAAKKRIGAAKKIALIKASAEGLPFEDNSLDIIISRGSVFFWEDKEKSYKELFRCIKPDGLILIGGGYGISTPDEIVDEIISYYKNLNSKDSKQKPKLNIDKTIELLNNIGGRANIVSKPKHGFWINWKKE